MQRDHISFFVSSTFNDMHLERDALHLEVMPRIAPLAARQLCSVQLLDLRWGVDTSHLDERESARKVLKVCLDGINNCRPFMIILLGDRYGYIPDQKVVSNVIEEHHIDSDFFAKSVTELEIQYGLLLNQEAECFIYFREIDYDRLDSAAAPRYRDDDEAPRQKLLRLKETLRAKYPSRIRTYHPEIDPDTGQIRSVGEFTRLVTEDIEKILLENSPEDEKLWQQKEEQAIERLLSRADQSMIPRAAQIDKLLRAANEHPLTILTGEAGGGKTTMLCQIERALQKQGRDHIAFFCGRSSFSSSLLSMQQYLAWQMEEKLGIAHVLRPGEMNTQTDTQRWQSYLSELCVRWHRKYHNKIIFLIDALDQLPQSEETARFIWAPEGLGSTWSCIASAQPQTRILREYASVQIGQLSITERVRIITEQFARYGKNLDYSVTKKMLSLPGSENPLYLRLILTRLLMLYRSDFEAINRAAAGVGAMESINRYLIGILEGLPENVEELGASVMIYAAELSADLLKGNKETLVHSLELIAVSRCGIRQCDLEAAFRLEGRPWNSLQFEWLRYFLDFCFSEQSDGRINFSHDSLRTGLLSAAGTDLRISHTLLARTLSASRDETALGDAFYHILHGGVEMSELLQKLFKHVADDKNNRLRDLFRQNAYDRADEGSSDTLRAMLARFTPEGLFYAAVIFQVFLDDRPEMSERLVMLHDCVGILKEFLADPPAWNALTAEGKQSYPEGKTGNYLRELEDEDGYALEIQSLLTQMLVIYADAVHTMESPAAALPYYQEALTHADQFYEMRAHSDKWYASSPAVYIAYSRMADLCMRLNKPEEGIHACRRGIRSLRSLNRQILFTGEDTSSPDFLLQSQMIRLTGMTQDNHLKEQVLQTARNVCAEAKLHYEVTPSAEALHSLFQAEAACADLLDDVGKTQESLDYYERALQHIQLLCAADYSLNSLMNRASVLLNICVILLKNGSSLAQEYAERAEAAANEASRLSRDDPEGPILCAYAKTIQCALLLKNSMYMQAADLCYELLDELEPWLETRCEPSYTERKRMIMELCAAILDRLDEPDTAALCREYESFFRLNAG